MSHTLRQITDAIWLNGPKATDDDERVRIYDRGRMLRDRGLILTSSSRTQGATTLYTDADAAAAALAITASLNGCSWGIIQALNSQLRKIGNTLGRPEFERHIEALRAGEPIFARLDIVSEPWDYTHAAMGSEAEVSLSAMPLKKGTTQVLFWPLAEIVTPVLAILTARSEA